MWGFLTSLIHGGDDDVTLRAAHENVPIDVRIQSTLNRVEMVVEFSAETLFCVLCLFHLLVQKLFLLSSNFFEHVQYFLNTVKFFDHGQKQDFTL